MPLISVIIPVFNGEKTIYYTIESVLNQTFTDFELIIINDGSTDQTLEIIGHFSDPRLAVFSYNNEGANKSRNRGINRSVGDYISFIDADDLWTVDKLEAQLKALQDHPKAAVSYSWTDAIDEAGNFLRPDSRAVFTGDVYPHLLLAYFLSNGSNPLIRKQAFYEVGLFDESLRSAQDWEMYLRLAAKYPFVAVPKPQILYRQSISSMSMNVVMKEVAAIAVIEKTFAQAPPSLQHLKKRSLGNLYKYLTVKVLEAPPTGNQGIEAFQLFRKTIKYDFTLLQKGISAKILYKIAILSLCPPQLAEIILKKTHKFVNTSTLLGYINLDIS
ncbi:glycosyltransferase [Planktothrix agardhii]|jgi:glycosyltransferase involved in cell wall biosynthesis|uniref:glycosyltransferase n=1 Tax=Planktothrix agardhii TaxID=1160 RepID=UPI0037840CE4